MTSQSNVDTDILRDDVKKEICASQNDMRSLYIGSDERVYRHLTLQFNNSYHKPSLHDGAKLLKRLYSQNSLLPDFLCIDLPFSKDELIEFFASLKSNILFTTIPVVYNEAHLNENSIKKLEHFTAIDDIINIFSDEINMPGKIMFLKQSKLHNQLLAATCVTHETSKRQRLTVSDVLKRSTDIFVAGMALLILLPVFVLIAIVIQCESRGSIFYTSLRAGKGFKTFKFYKFRSMISNADTHVEKLSALNQYAVDGNGPKFFKVSNDPRVTKFGKFLRNVSADELPQLFNILKGDMSLVGNRPLPIYEAISLTTDQFVERFSAPAGLTGLWQVDKRGKNDMSIEERINLDITYSRNYNFIYDLKILAKTPKAMFQKNNV